MTKIFLCKTTSSRKNAKKTSQVWIFLLLKNFRKFSGTRFFLQICVKKFLTILKKIWSCYLKVLKILGRPDDHACFFCLVFSRTAFHAFGFFDLKFPHPAQTKMVIQTFCPKKGNNETNRNKNLEDSLDSTNETDN